jgi:hypothetical protein
VAGLFGCRGTFLVHRASAQGAALLTSVCTSLSDARASGQRPGAQARHLYVCVQRRLHRWQRVRDAQRRSECVPDLVSRPVQNVRFGWSAHGMDNGFNFWASERPLVIVEALECRIHIDHRASS